MIDGLRFESFVMDSQNYIKLLKSSLGEFYAEDEIGASAFLSKYKTASSSTEIIHCKLQKELEEISSCVLVKRLILVDEYVIPFYFLTQVVTAEKYRGSGYVRMLLGEVEKLMISKGIPIMIVIARRSAHDLYSKLGFKGFSHFPEMVSIASNPTQAFTDFRQAGIQDIQKLHKINGKTSAYLNGRVQRTIEDWKLILDFQSESTYRVFLPLGESIESYIISKGRIGLEIGSISGMETDQDFLKSMLRNFEKFYIDKNNSLSKYFRETSWIYSERFEANEGHLIKLVSKVPSAAQMFFDEAIKVDGHYRLRIDPVDQW